jgi:hypothetical protein
VAHEHSAALHYYLKPQCVLTVPRINDHARIKVHSQRDQRKVQNQRGHRLHVLRELVLRVVLGSADGQRNGVSRARCGGRATSLNLTVRAQHCQSTYVVVRPCRADACGGHVRTI